MGAFTTGLELVNNELAFAEHQNVELMGARGNQVIDGVGVTPQGTPDLTVAVASGNVLAGGVVVAVSSGNIDLSSEHGALTSGQAQFVFIHVNSSGTKSSTAGVAAAAGQQLPADVPEDEVVLAQITLTEGDPTIDSVDIEDWKINVPKGGYFAGDLVVNGASGVDNLHIIGDEDQGLLLQRLSSNVTDNVGLRFKVDVDTGATVIKGGIFFQRTTSWSRGIIHFANEATADGTNVTIADSKLDIYNNGDIKNPVDNAGFFTGASDDLRMYHDGTNSFLTSAVGPFLITTTAVGGSMHFRLGGSYFIQDSDDSTVTLFELNTTSRTLTIGASADKIATTHNGDFNMGAVGDRNSFNIPSVNYFMSIIRSDSTQHFHSDDNGIDFQIRSGAERNVYLYGTNASFRQNFIVDGSIKSQVDNAGFHTGASDDLRLHHTNDVSFLTNTTGELILEQLAAGLGIQLRVGGQIIFRDVDDSLVELFIFDTGARTLTVGIVADPIVTTFNGDVILPDNISLFFGTGSDFDISYNGIDLSFDSPADENIYFNQRISIQNSGSTHAYALQLGSSSAEAQTIDEAIAEAWNLWSSSRWKENFRDIKSPLKIINQLNPLLYDLKEASEPKHYNKIGFIAEDLGKILPELVNWEDEPSEDGIIYATGIDYARLTALNMAAIKELYKLIKEK